MTTEITSDDKPNHAQKELRQDQERGLGYNLLVLRDIRQMFGPPPVLSTENVKAYDQMLLRTIQCLRPRDFMERMFIKHLTDSNWEIIRYTRHTTLHLERKYRQVLECRAPRVKAAALSKQPQADESSSSPVAVLPSSPTEFDHADALERGIDYAERLDKLRNSAIARRDDVLHQMEQYREGLGRDSRHISDDIIKHGFSRHGQVICEDEPYFTSEIKAFLKEIKPVEDPRMAATREWFEETAPKSEEPEEAVPASTSETKGVEQPVSASGPECKQAQPPSASPAGGNDDLGS